MATSSTISILSNPTTFGSLNASGSAVNTGLDPNTFGAINTPQNTPTQPISLLSDQSTLPQSLDLTSSPSINSPIVVPDRTALGDTSATPLSNPFTSLQPAPDYTNSVLSLSPPSTSGSLQLPAGSGAILGDGTPAASTDSANAGIDFASQINGSTGTQDQSAINSFLGVPPASPLDVGSLQGPATAFTSPLASISSALGSLESVLNIVSSGADQWDRVKLRFFPGHPFASYPGIMNPLNATSGMVWLYRPEVSISENVDYESVPLVHSLQEIHSFTSNRAQTISITGQFFSQQLDEALYAIAAIHFMRTVCKMSFGAASAVPIGAPPPILLLSGYGQEMMNDLPVIVTAFSMELPNQDVDYIRIPSGPAAGTKIPVSFTLTANLTVQRSSTSMRSFNLGTYAASGQANFW